MEEALGKLTDRMQIKREHGVSLLQSLLRIGGIHLHSYSLSKNLIFQFWVVTMYLSPFRGLVVLNSQRLDQVQSQKICTSENINFVLWERVLGGFKSRAWVNPDLIHLGVFQPLNFCAFLISCNSCKCLLHFAVPHTYSSLILATLPQLKNGLEFCYDICLTTVVSF